MRKTNEDAIAKTGERALRAATPKAEITRDELEEVTHATKITCFNRDSEGVCLAFTSGICSKDCSARITTIQAKIDLLASLLNYARSSVDKTRLRSELDEAFRVKQAVDSGKYEDWMACYYEDRHRGSGGGSSEHDSNRSTGMKTLLKDNRGIDTKPTRAESQEYQDALQKWEEENEKLPRLSRSSLGKSKTDSYLED